MAAINIPFGGWEKTEYRESTPVWGGGVFTDGEDPNGEKGVNWQSGGGSQPASPASPHDEPHRPRFSVFRQLQSAQGNYNNILQDYLGANKNAAGFEQNYSIQSTGRAIPIGFRRIARNMPKIPI